MKLLTNQIHRPGKERRKGVTWENMLSFSHFIVVMDKKKAEGNRFKAAKLTGSIPLHLNDVHKNECTYTEKQEAGRKEEREGVREGDRGSSTMLPAALQQKSTANHSHNTTSSTAQNRPRHTERGVICT